MPTFLRKKNNAKSNLLNLVTQGDSTITVRDSGLFPATGSFMVTVWNKNQIPDPSDDSSMEIMKVTTVNGRIFTVDRGQEGTTVKTHNMGNAVELLFTVGQIEELESEIQTLSFQSSGENHWDRNSGSDTIVPFIANSNLDIGSGNITTTGTGSFNALTLTGDTSVISSAYAIDFKLSGEAAYTLRLEAEPAVFTLGMLGGNRILRITSDDANSIDMELYEDSTHWGSWHWSKQFDGFVITSSSGIAIIPNDDQSDFIEFTTANNVPRMTSVGNSNLEIFAEGGQISFDDEDLITTGSFTITAGGNGDGFWVADTGDWNHYIAIHTAGLTPAATLEAYPSLVIDAQGGGISCGGENFTTTGIITTDVLTVISSATIPFSHSGFAATNVNDAIEELLDNENLWNRAGTTLSPNFLNDSVDIGSGNITTEGSIFTTTAGGQIGRFMTGSSGNTVFAYTG
ncbi:hypothetical protein LCGC14_1841370, partial [marine sediment metagenome]